MNVANVATLDIPVATLIPLEQYLSVLLVFLLKHLFLSYQPSSLSLDHVQIVRNLWILHRVGPKDLRQRGLMWNRWIYIIAHHFK